VDEIPMRSALQSLSLIKPDCRLARVEICGEGKQMLAYSCTFEDGFRLCIKIAKANALHIQREAMALTRLVTPHVPELFINAAERGFLVVEHIDGLPFTEETRPHLLPHLASIARSLSDFLKELSMAPAIVHRDLKPRHLLYRAGSVVVLDFGSSEIEGSRRNQPQLSQIRKLGGRTHVFQPPEQLVGSAEQDRRVDVFAAASIVFSILTGRPPFSNDVSGYEEARCAYRRIEKDNTRFMAKWPAPVRDALVKCLRVDAEQRSHNLDELATALEHNPVWQSSC
jgi:serine/threonine protein kinase